jgi:hypothetical protein
MIFEGMPNPILTLVTFLSTTVSPSVAAAAAHEALRLVGEYAEAQEVADLKDWLHIGQTVSTAQGNGVVTDIAEPDLEGAERLVTFKLERPLVEIRSKVENATEVTQPAVKVEGADLQVAARVVRPYLGQGSARPAVRMSLPMELQVEVARKCLMAAAIKVPFLSLFPLSHMLWCVHVRLHVFVAAFMNFSL